MCPIYEVAFSSLVIARVIIILDGNPIEYLVQALPRKSTLLLIPMTKLKETVIILRTAVNRSNISYKSGEIRHVNDNSRYLECQH
jgi:hypothetical protein